MSGRQVGFSAHAPVFGNFNMTEALYLVIYLLSYSSGFAGIAVCWFAKRHPVPQWVKWYSRWLWSAIFFLLVRNGAYFAKYFLGFPNIEQEPVFYILYMVCSGLFVFQMVILNGKFLYPAFSRSTWWVASLGGGAILALNVFLLPFFPDGQSLRMLIINVVMYYCFAAVIASLVVLAFHLRKKTERFDKNIIKAFMASGLFYFVCGGIQWFSYMYQEYDLVPFSIVNVSLFIIFSANTVLMGKRFIAETWEPNQAQADSGLARYPGLSEIECRIVGLIKQGATNQEISQSTGLSLAMVKNRIYRLSKRFKVNSRIELLRAVKESQLLANQAEASQ